MRTKGHFRDPLGYINIGKESGGCATGDGGHREHRGNRRDRADWVKKIRHEVKPLPSYGSNKL